MTTPTLRRSPSLLAAALLGALAAGCSTGLSVVGGPDAGADAGKPDRGDLDVVTLDAPGMDAPDAPGMDTPDAPEMDAPDAPADVPPDVPVDVVTRCATSADCAGNPAGGACDVDTGRCVPCVPGADTCPVGQYCSGNTCVAGCRNDEACAPAGGGDGGVADGGAGLPRAGRCNVPTRACVECVVDEHCPAGLLCVGNVCVSGCTEARPCPGLLQCCTGACIDTVSNVASCGACGVRCSVPNANAACQNGMCAVGTCIAPFGDCDRAPGNGCEVNTLMATEHCGGCGLACPARPNAASRCDAGRCAFACNPGFGDCDGNADNGCEVDLRRDPTHCGQCTTACNPPNATPACVDGACAVGACATGFGDCDANPTNGCEVALADTVAHCGRCANRCAARPNAFPGCLGGECFTSCVMGYQDCDGVAENGCEVDARGDLGNCGGCGRRCAPSNATGACATGRCTIMACDDGFADCDGNADNGCEVNLRGDVSHCGACRMACMVSGGTPACSAGVCGLSMCAAGRGDCDRSAANGCEVDLSTTAAHCGTCGAVCDLPNATASCAGGRCAVASCAAGFADCNGNPADGCEVNVRADAAHCGGCGMRCAPANAAGACVAGACTIAACTGGAADCDGAAGNGCEVNLASDVNHCGACPSRCALANATAACASGRCLVASCAAGFADCNANPSDGCEVNLNTTPGSCGACGRACALANASGNGCAGGQCTVTACVGGFGNCDGAAANGCEANLASDPSHCGACGRRPAEVCNLADDTCNGRCDEDAGCRTPIFRYFNRTTGEHFYTVSRNEVSGGAWVEEGAPAFYLYASNAGGLSPFYRCVLSNGKHFYTTSASCEGSPGSRLEGTLGFIAGSAQCGATPLHRLVRNANGDHLYTTDPVERGTAQASGGYVSEGDAGFVWLAPGG
ncbi:MAG: hypothetical protein Q7V43_11865 [Myxococcales bacterium]|nr:hypothetical protein [Myxococcales bacterium]